MLYETWADGALPRGSTLRVTSMNPFGLSDEIVKHELLSRLSVLRSIGLVAAIGESQQDFAVRLAQSQRRSNRLHPRSFEHFLHILTSRAAARKHEGDFASAAFYWSKARDQIWQACKQKGPILSNSVPWPQQYVMIAYSQARALLECKVYKRAHTVIESTISKWKTYPIFYIPNDQKAVMCCLRAELDEHHGGLLKLRNALFWFQETLRHNPEHPTAEEAIERLKKKIYFADSSNW